MASSMLQQGEDAFRKLFKFYRRKNPPPDFSDVIDFSNPGNHSVKVFNCDLNAALLSDGDACRAGLHPVCKWKAFGLDGYPGFIFISNPFLPGSQRHWVKQCLKVYPQKPNTCNLDMHMSPTDTDNLWEKSRDQIRQKCAAKREPKSLLEKLRWVTNGYHYNWDTKTYSADHYTPFPSDLNVLSEGVAAACGFQNFKAEAGILNYYHFDSSLGNSADHYTPFPSDLNVLSEGVAAACGFQNFKAEAGILNYYHFDSSLGIHVDESELDHSRPLLSFSFGQSAVFLLGGLRREDPATPMFMHSGDIMVMSGSSRLLYHAVPRIVSSPDKQAVPQCLVQELADDTPEDSVVQNLSEEDWAVCAKYIQTSRINMTVRQVLGLGKAFPTEPDNENTVDIQPGTYHEGSSDSEESNVKRKKQ
ncbi:UNVERIFIED_CONTAM: hypothetical protein FKN15_078435 [Acipenser sinensis]